VNFDTVRLVYFSPTKTTQKILEGIAQGTAAGKVEHLDLTPPEAKTAGQDEMQDELVLLGVPVYGGRVPRSPSCSNSKQTRHPRLSSLYMGIESLRMPCLS